MPGVSTRNKELLKAIAKRRIEILIALSEKALKQGDQKLSKRYASLASKIQSHYRVKPSLRYIVCKGCGALLVPGITSSIRLSSKNRYIVVKCLLCGKELHKVYKK